MVGPDACIVGGGSAREGEGSVSARQKATVAYRAALEEGLSVEEAAGEAQEAFDRTVRREARGQHREQLSDHVSPVAFVCGRARGFGERE